jgi:hypothetical protein
MESAKKSCVLASMVTLPEESRNSRKLDHPQNPKHIQTVRGRGYKFTS